MGTKNDGQMDGTDNAPPTEADAIGNPTANKGRERLLELAEEEGLRGRDGMTRAELAKKLNDTMTPEDLEEGLSDDMSPQELVASVKANGPKP